MDKSTSTLHEAACCVVGAGPAGAMLALLLARRGVPVVLVESQADFDRDFRGDSIHPAIMEVLDQIDLAGELLALPHRRIGYASIPSDPPVEVSFSRLRTSFPFMTLMPQTRFLEFLTAQASRYPCFTLLMRSPVRGMLVTDGRVHGVVYEGPDGLGEIRAGLTIGTDGRSSTIRRLSKLNGRTFGSAIDVLWWRLPRLPDDPEGIVGGIARGRLLLMVDRDDQWQIGTIIPKGSYRALRAATGGIESLHDSLRHAAPWLGDRIGLLNDWEQVAFLSVRADLLRRWWAPGLLLLGDAAHTMSPFAGNGINYAIADAVAAANVLVPPLTAGQVHEGDLRAVQRRRFWPTRVTQMGVAFAQDRMVARLGRDRAVGPPAPIRLALRTPLLRDIGPRVAAFGIRPERLTRRYLGR